MEIDTEAYGDIIVQYFENSNKIGRIKIKKGVLWKTRIKRIVRSYFKAIRKYVKNKLAKELLIKIAWLTDMLRTDHVTIFGNNEQFSVAYCKSDMAFDGTTSDCIEYHIRAHTEDAALLNIHIKINVDLRDQSPIIVEWEIDRSVNDTTKETVSSTEIFHESIAVENLVDSACSPYSIKYKVQQSLPSIIESAIIGLLEDFEIDALDHYCKE